MIRAFIMVAGYSVLCVGTAYGYPWNIPAVMAGGVAVGILAARLLTAEKSA